MREQQGPIQSFANEETRTSFFAYDNSLAASATCGLCYLRNWLSSIRKHLINRGFGE